jgi:hypothetical protein
VDPVPSASTFTLVTLRAPLHTVPACAETATAKTEATSSAIRVVIVFATVFDPFAARLTGERRAPFSKSRAARRRRSFIVFIGLVAARERPR